MAELSRKKRFQALRDQIDQETTSLQPEPAAPVKLSRSARPAPAVQKGNANAATAAKPAMQTVAVMDELLGEVKQYNISKGDRVAEDTQINILRTLDEAGDIEIKRRAHLETMEPNQEAGGTTMNINSMDIQEVSRAANRNNPSIFSLQSKPALEPVLEEEEIIADLPAGRGTILDEKLSDDSKMQAEDDHLELFDLNAADFSSAPAAPQEPEQPLSRKEAKAAKKARKAAKKAAGRKSDQLVEETVPADPYLSDTGAYEYGDDEPQKSGIIGNVILIVLILALICLIGYTIYLISKANLL